MRLLSVIDYYYPLDALDATPEKIQQFSSHDLQKWLCVIYLLGYQLNGKPELKSYTHGQIVACLLTPDQIAAAKARFNRDVRNWGLLIVATLFTVVPLLYLMMVFYRIK